MAGPSWIRQYSESVVAAHVAADTMVGVAASRLRREARRRRRERRERGRQCRGRRRREGEEGGAGWGRSGAAGAAGGRALAPAGSSRCASTAESVGSGRCVAGVCVTHGVQVFGGDIDDLAGSRSKTTTSTSNTTHGTASRRLGQAAAQAAHTRAEPDDLYPLPHRLTYGRLPAGRDEPGGDGAVEGVPNGPRTPHRGPQRAVTW